MAPYCGADYGARYACSAGYTPSSAQNAPPEPFASVRSANSLLFEPLEIVRIVGADYGARTRHLDLGKVALYQMS